ncbi:MAG: hypothetical protein JNK82_04545 [Myxococcaceae bacterium]|nr:hypothetical protein [Myxococcaceae bacterium]
MTRRLALFALVIFAGCQKMADALSVPPQRLKSADGALEITVPSTWTDDSTPARQLNDQAVLQASNRAGELYVIVLTEEKADLAEMDLKKFSEITRGSQLQAMKNGAEEGPKERTINGMPAIEYTLRGTVEKANVVMMHLSVEGAKRYHQVLVWTLKSKWDGEKANLEAVAASLKELGAGASEKRAPAPN